MIKNLLLTSGLVLSVGAMAVDFNELSQGLDTNIDMLMPEHNRPNPGRGRPDLRRPARPEDKKKECARTAWRHTRPSQAQNDSAKQILTAAMTQVRAGMPAVRTAFGEVHKALAKHPISKPELQLAVDGVEKVAGPLKTLVREAHVDVINLLNMDQRNVFNQVLHRCLKGTRQP